MSKAPANPVESALLTDSGKDKPVRPGWWLRAGCLMMVVAAALHSADRSIGGGDTWVAMACGRYTLGPWAVGEPNRTWQMRLLDHVGLHLTQRDFMGAKTRAFVPGDKDQIGWINQNWLTHVLFYKLKTIGTHNPIEENRLGENLIVGYKFLQAILTALFAYWAARVLGAHPFLAAAAVSFGTLLSRSFIDLRPNVSSILFAVVMILILAYWRNRRYRAIWWMIPVMILWSNVHGGFIYAIMIFGLVLAARLAQIIMVEFLPNSFVRTDARGFGTLLLGTTAVVIIPAVFSPFGMENLIHPLTIATGEEGAKWRHVVEWLPIWDKNGFGNASPYIVFLVIFGVAFLLWWIAFLGKPKMPQFIKPKRGRQESCGFAWPRIDLSLLAIMGITVAMSIQSRRFIFLGGLVLSPFLAQLAHESIVMIAARIRHRQEGLAEPLPLSARRTRWLTLGSWATAVVLGGIFTACMYDTYYAPPADGQNYSVFRRMVGISDQPVEAMKFMEANHLQGIVLNEWTQGGFVTFHQTPQPQNGQAPCKVFMDGRAQAAYDLSQFTNHSRLMGASAKSDPAKFEEVLQHEGINVIMIDLRKSENLFNLIWRTPKWRLLFFDGTQMSIWAKEDDPRNAALLTRFSTDQMVWPDENLRKISLGYRLASSTRPELATIGLDMLCDLEPGEALPTVYEMIASTALRLNQPDKAQRFFEQLYQHSKILLDRGERFGRRQYLSDLAYSTNGLMKLTKNQSDAQQRSRYTTELEIYQKKIKQLYQTEMNGWLW